MITADAYCPICTVKFASVERKVHLKSDWHVYNLKRIVASLPPMPESEFAKKQAFFVEKTDGIAASDETKKKMYCQYCKKSFNSLKSHENHLASKQHTLNVDSFNGKQAFEEKMTANRTMKQAEPETETDSEDETSGQAYPLPVGACLFCDRRFESPTISAQEAADRVLRHMSDSHAFTPPYADQLRDPAGLLSDLGHVVGEEYACIACGRQFLGRTKGELPQSARERRKQALAAVRAHMRDAEHQYLFCGTEDPVEMALAVAEAQEQREENGLLRAESLPPVARIGGEIYSRFYAPVQSNRTLVLPEEEDDSAFEVRLPSGAVLGHRKYYQKVYRQHLPLPRTASEERRRALALTHTSYCVPLAIAAQHNQTGHQQHTALVQSTSIGGMPGRLSRVDTNHQRARKEIFDKYNLDLGIRGNFVLRGHLRRQY